MPKGVYDRQKGWHRHTFTGRGDWEESPLEPIPQEFNRGELRLAAEVARARMVGKPVEQRAVLKAFEIFARLADAI